MTNFPYPRFFNPGYYSHNRSNYGFSNNLISNENVNNTSFNNNLKNDEKKELRMAASTHSRSFGPVRFNFDDPFNINKEEPIIEILGISLYLDDLIIIGLLFFLYQEGVKDEFLFFTLILLLLT